MAGTFIPQIPRLSLVASLPQQHNQQMNAHFETFLWNQAIENKGTLATNLSIVYSLIKLDIVPCLSANVRERISFFFFFFPFFLCKQSGITNAPHVFEILNHSSSFYMLTNELILI